MPILVDRVEGGVRTLVLNRPERANAFNGELIHALQEAMTAAQHDAQTRVIVLTASGRAFSAGQDIGEMRSGEVISYREHLAKTYNPLVAHIRRIDKPVIAALNGACAGAALGIALACDLRFASEGATLVVGFGSIALVPDSAVSLLLPLMIGLGRAEYYYMTNEPIPAPRALELGLVNGVFPEASFMPQCMARAAELARGPVGAYGLAKQAFNQAVLSNLEVVLKTEADLQEIAGRGAEHQEGIAAFGEKRPPKY